MTHTAPPERRITEITKQKTQYISTLFFTTGKSQKRNEQVSHSKEMLIHDTAVHLKQIKTLYFTDYSETERKRAYCDLALLSACFSH